MLLFLDAGFDDVVPLAVKFVGMQVDPFHLLCGDLAACGVFALIQATDYAQAFRRGGAADQIDDRFVIHQRLATPV